MENGTQVNFNLWTHVVGRFLWSTAPCIFQDFLSTYDKCRTAYIEWKGDSSGILCLDISTRLRIWRPPEPPQVVVYKENISIFLNHVQRQDGRRKEKNYYVVIQSEISKKASHDLLIWGWVSKAQEMYTLQWD